MVTRRATIRVTSNTAQSLCASPGERSDGFAPCAQLSALCAQRRAQGARWRDDVRGRRLRTDELPLRGAAAAARCLFVFQASEFWNVLQFYLKGWGCPGGVPPPPIDCTWTSGNETWALSSLKRPKCVAGFDVRDMHDLNRCLRAATGLHTTEANLTITSCATLLSLPALIECVSLAAMCARTSTATRTATPMAKEAAQWGNVRCFLACSLADSAAWAKIRCWTCRRTRHGNTQRGHVELRRAEPQVGSAAWQHWQRCSVDLPQWCRLCSSLCAFPCVLVCSLQVFSRATRMVLSCTARSKSSSLGALSLCLQADIVLLCSASRCSDAEKSADGALLCENNNCEPTVCNYAVSLICNPKLHFCLCFGSSRPKVTAAQRRCATSRSQRLASATISRR